MLRPLRHPFRSSASPEESAFPSDMETCAREYVPVCPPGRSGPFCRKLCGYSLPVHAGIPFSPVSVSCFVPFHSSSSHQALPYEQETYAFCGTGGSTDNNLEIYHEMSGSEDTGYSVVGYFDGQANPAFPVECPYLGQPAQVQEYLEKHDYVHYLFCCLPSKDREVIVSLIDYCENHLVHFFSVPNVRNYLHHRMSFNIMGNVPYLGLRPDPLSWPGNRLLKRAFDIVVSSVFLCTLFPIILIVVAIVTGLTMPGPLFFRQKRNGLNGREFYCYKFRSMKVNADADRIQATEHDPRKTRWGNIMRKTNIDELPQFINVLLGDMSIVGPRPHMLLHTQEYSRLINKYMVRHFVKPGITGWSQVTGFRGETKELKDMEGRIRGDIWYLEHWSFGLDLYIMYRTVANVFRGEKNAY